MVWPEDSFCKLTIALWTQNQRDVQKVAFEPNHFQAAFLTMFLQLKGKNPATSIPLICKTCNFYHGNLGAFTPPKPRPRNSRPIKGVYEVTKPYLLKVLPLALGGGKMGPGGLLGIPMDFLRDPRFTMDPV